MRAGREAPGLQVLGTVAGMQLLLALAADTDDVALAEAAAAQGINIFPLSPLHLEPSPQQGLLAGFGRLPELGRWSDALPVMKEADAIYRELAEANPDRYRPDLAQIMVNLGITFSALRRTTKALPVVC